MSFNIIKLNTILKEVSHFAVYGCGDYACKTYEMLRKLKKQPDYFVVSDNKNSSQLYENAVPIYSFNQKVEDIRERNLLIIIAVSRVYSNEIENNLRNNEINNFIAITDFEIVTSEYNKQYLSVSANECIQRIAEWHLGYIEDYQTDVTDEIHDIERQISDKNKDENKIMFVIGDLSPRTVKIAGAMLQKGYKIDILTEPGAKLRTTCISELNSLKLPYIECKTVDELMYRMIMCNGKVIHLFTHFVSSYIDRILIQMKNLFVPIVYDEYDIVNAGYTNISQDILNNERYCLEHTDAICNRWYDVIDNLRVKHGFRITTKTIQFLDYCSDKQSIKAVNLNSLRKELSLCYVGGVVSKSEYPDFIEAFDELAKACEANRCHFHVYPSEWNEERLKDYIELDDMYEYFHIHKPVPYECLSSEISKYDYGIFPIKRQYLGQNWTYYTNEVLLYAATNKYFDYLDAGLPVIAATPMKFAKYLENEGVLINWTINEYDFEFLRHKHDELKNIITKVHNKLSVRSHIDELLEFYDSLIE